MRENELSAFYRTVARIESVRRQTEDVFKDRSIILAGLGKRFKLSVDMLESLLGEQRAQMDAILENSSLGVVIAENGKFIKVNSAFGELLGFTKEELVGKGIPDVTLVADLPETKIWLLKMDLGEIDSFSIKKRYRKKDGGVLVCNTNVSAVRDASGMIRYRVAVIEAIANE